MVLKPNLIEGPLSFCQELLLFQEVSTGHAPVILRSVRIVGSVCPDRFQMAADQVIQSHPQLQSTVYWQGDVPIAKISSCESSEPLVEFVNPEQKIDAKQVHASLLHLSEKFKYHRPPHMRHQLIKLGESEYIWNFCAHHMFADAISLQHYGKSFSSAYCDAPSNAPNAPFAYAQSQRQWLQSTEAQQQLDDWIAILDAVPNQESGFETHSASELESDQCFQQSWLISSDTRNNLDELAKLIRVPLSAILTAAFARVIARRGDLDSVTLLMNVPGRSLPGASLAVGCFYNTLPLVLETGLESFEKLASATADALFSVMDRQELPISLLNLALQRNGQQPIASRFPISLNVVVHPLSHFALPECTVYQHSHQMSEAPRLGHVEHTVVIGKEGTGTDATNWTVCVTPNGIQIFVEYSAGVTAHTDVADLLKEFACELSNQAETPLNSNASEGVADLLIADWS